MPDVHLSIQMGPFSLGLQPSERERLIEDVVEYLEFLAHRRVLYVALEYEVTAEVVQSVESIRAQTVALRQKLSPYKNIKAVFEYEQLTKIIDHCDRFTRRARKHGAGRSVMLFINEDLPRFRSDLLATLDYLALAIGKALSDYPHLHAALDNQYLGDAELDDPAADSY